MTGIFFEVLAKDQNSLSKFYSRLFGWQYRQGSGGEKSFLYVEGTGSGPIRGGIGHASKPVTGSNAAFYIMVDDVPASFDLAIKLGGSADVKPTSIDGYTFAEFLDPEGNRVGVVSTFPT